MGPRVARLVLAKVPNMRETKIREIPSIKPWAVGLEVLFLGVVAVIAGVALDRLEDEVRSDAGDTLDAVLETSQESLSLWAEQRQHDVVLLARDPVLVQLTEAQLVASRGQEDLAQSASTERLRDFFRQRPDRYGGDGFFLIDSSGISIGSIRDQNIGTENFLWTNKRALIEQVFAGNSVFVPPVDSDVPVANSEGKLVAGGPTLFFAAPIRDTAGNVIAALTVRHAPERDFSRIAELARVGGTGETYAFDEQGRLLTLSRFEDELRRTGRLEPGSTSILSVSVTEPGSGRATLPVRQAIAGERGRNTTGYRDYRGVQVFGAWMWSDALGFGLTAELDEEEALAPYRSVRRMVVLVLAITVALALLLTALAVRIQRVGVRTLRDREERLRAVLDTAVDGILTFNERRRVESANPAAVAMFGFTHAKIVGKDVGELIKTTDGQGLHPRRHDCEPESGHECQCEYVGHRQDGTRFELEVGIGDSLFEGKRLFIGVVRDVSKRKLLEAQLLRSQKLEAVGQLAAGVAHDFNNLLMGIGGCADIAISRVEETHDARVYMEHVRSAAKSGAAISQQLLSLARQSDSRPREESALDAIIATARPMLARLLGEEIRLTVKYESGLAIPRCAGGQIEQIIINLTVNARDAIGNGGEIHISTWQERFASDAPYGLKAGRYLALSVADNGCGIDDATRERIFEPFFSTKPIGKGTGLGLSTVHGIARDNGGTIALESKPGIGSSFTVYLPWMGDASSSRAVESEHDTRHSGTVLLVEDDPLVRMTVHDYLQRAGYRVVEARDGEEAVRIASYEHLDLVVSDTVLPGPSGAEVAQAVTLGQPSLPVVLMSAHPADYLEETGHIKAGTPILQKPFSQRQLLEAIPPGTQPCSEGIALGDVVPVTKEDAKPPELRILLVEDNNASRLATSILLREEGLEVIATANAREALQAYERDYESVDVLVADIGLPDMSIGRLVESLNQIRPIPQTVFVSGRSEDDPCVQELLGNDGCYFMSKPVDVDGLARAIRQAAS